MSSLHQHAKDLFLAALARPLAERDAFVAEACGTDANLRLEVESLLAFHSGSDGAGLPTVSVPSRDTFEPGALFAERYRMVTRVGRGGMGDVWRAEDIMLDTPVALKLIRGTGPAARQRILNEVRLARQITHPAVCRVFDVGEHAGEAFYSMELVKGEDLAALLKRAGRLPSEKVIDIGLQLCGGLEAAHLQGVLHRDLKPANVLIDDEGKIRITDFGIAVPQQREEEAVPFGTPGYMAPEQLTPGRPLSERTDLYALGVMLYELVTGHHPIDRLRTAVQRPSLLVSDLNPQFERVIMRLLAPDPRDRPASATEVASLLSGLPKADTGRTMTWWMGAAALAATIVLAALVYTFLRPAPAGSLSERDTIVLADFSNTTGEPVFDGALKVALAVALEQSPFLRVVPDDRLRETLRLMGQAPDTPISRTIGRQIAQREGSKALLAGSIASLGRNYVLSLEAVNALTGDIMAREQVEAANKEDVLTALGSVASRLREKLGESLASIQSFDVPLASATTPSLEALHAYSLALDQGTVNPRRESIPHLQRAIDLDPNFALAMALLATVYANTGQTALAPEFARRAFELRDRVSERERFFIEFRYYRDATQDWAKALELTRSWTAVYPREAFAFNGVGSALVRFGQPLDSLEPFRQAIRLDPKFAAPYSNLAGALVVLNRLGEAKEVLQQAAAQGIDTETLRRLSYLIAFVEGDEAVMSRVVTATPGPGDATALAWRAHVAAFEGRLRDAHLDFRRGVMLALQGDSREVAAQVGVEDAEAHAVVGQCSDARTEVAEALMLSRDNFTIERGSRALALCGATREATPLVRELEERFPEATFTIRVSLPVTTAALAMARRDARRVIELLEPVRPYDRAQRAEHWPAYLRGEAALHEKDGRLAAAEFQSIVDHRSEDVDSQLYPLAHLGLARAAVLSGDAAQARRSYEQFLSLWRSADADLQILKDAQRESVAAK